MLLLSRLGCGFFFGFRAGIAIQGGGWGKRIIMLSLPQKQPKITIKLISWEL